MKLKKMERGACGLICELLGSLLASHFEITTPQPAIVYPGEELADAAASFTAAEASAIRKSVGWNFGSELFRGAVTWPIDKQPPPTLLETAADIFALDALIQNPDRRFNNPNVVVLGDDLIVFDHEAAFSFLLALLPSPCPWSLNDQDYLKDHVFLSQLRGRAHSYSRFEAALQALAPTLLDKMIAEIPHDWIVACENKQIASIRAHIDAVAAHAEEFIAAVKRRLA